MQNASTVDRLREDVARICTPRGRMVGSTGHRQAREYLAGRLREMGLRPYRGTSFGMPYRDLEREFFNLAGVIPRGEGIRPPVLIGAHYDSIIAAPCADDNAAAVAIALAAAAQLSERRLGRDVVVALFDAEEPPYFLGPSMGSTRFHEEQMLPEGVHAAIIMDLVGHDVSISVPGAAMLRPRIARMICMTGAESHPELASLVARQDFGELVPIATPNSNIGDMSDHHVFRRHGVPYLFLTCGRWKHYHQPSDTSEKLSYAKMSRIVDLVVGLTAALAGAPLERPPGEAAGAPVVCDTVALELQLLRKALGPLSPLILAALGLKKLNTRGDLDALAQRLQGMI